MSLVQAKDAGGLRLPVQCRFRNEQVGGHARSRLRCISEEASHVITTVHFFFHLHIQRTPFFFSRQRSHHFLHGANDRGAALLPIPNRFDGEGVAFGVQINQQIRSSQPLRKVGSGTRVGEKRKQAEDRGSAQGGRSATHEGTLEHLGESGKSEEASNTDNCALVCC